MALHSPMVVGVLAQPVPSIAIHKTVRLLCRAQELLEAWAESEDISMGLPCSIFEGPEYFRCE